MLGVCFELDAALERAGGWDDIAVNDAVVALKRVVVSVRYYVRSHRR